VRLALLGVRGSTPAPGAEFVRYGGHTSCVAVSADGARVPRLVLDAGTGLRDLGPLLGGAAYTGSIVLTHLHWDHVQGLPFCPAVDRPDARVEVYLPGSAGDPKHLLERGMSPPHFPIGPDGLLGAWRFLPSESREIEGFSVTVAPIVHKGGITHGIRIEADGVAVAYLPDHAPQLGSSAAAEALAADVDLLLHDAQYLAGERDIADAYGHPTIPDVLEFADRCRARRLVLTHHAPTRTDDELDALAKEMIGESRLVEVARQGTQLVV
jgi:phosphoribosyl 1,2-cyclic phosphodiesterase